MREADLVLTVVSVLLVVLSVGAHYEALRLAWSVHQRSKLAHRARVIVGLLIAFFAHVLEAMLFAAGWGLLLWLGVAQLSVPQPTAIDVLHLSFSTYTSLGYGDIVPVADARLLAGIESLLGLVLIAWTASFTYLQMTVNWRDEP